MADLSAVGLAQLVLFPVQLGWAALYWWTGRKVRKRRFDVATLVVASLCWLVAVWLSVVKVNRATAMHDGVHEGGTMWLVILSTTAAYLSFTLVLAAAAIWRWRSTTRR